MPERGVPTARAHRSVLTTRAALAGARRVVVKVGSSSLTGGGDGLDVAVLVSLVNALAAARSRGTEVVLVSSGAIAAGLAPLGLRRRPRDLATQQAAASVGQGELVARYAAAAAAHGLRVGQVLLTSDDVARRVHYANAQRTFERLLALGVVPVVNENDTVASAEIRFGDNDRLAALVAQLVRADALVLLTDVDALHDGPPSRPGSRRIGEVLDARGWADVEGADVSGVGSAVGTGGMITKLAAARTATSTGIAVVLGRTDALPALLAGEDVGTFFAPTAARRRARSTWMGHAAQPSGALVLDAGAVRALTQRGASLLAAGVVAVEGTFGVGDVVDLVGPDGAVVARGQASHPSSAVPAMLGRSSTQLEPTGSGAPAELVHRDRLVLVAAPLPSDR